MAKSEKLKQTHAAQVIAAEKEFTAYKDFIVKEFVDEFGGSYQTAEGLKDVWRTAFIYTPKCEKFLIKKTILFICMLSTKNRDFKSPVFFKNLIGKISEYLSSYIAKKGESKHNCAQYLRNIFTQNSHVKSRIEEYVGYNKKIWNDKKKKNDSKPIKITYHLEQSSGGRTKQLWLLIQEKQKEIALIDIKTR